jgi:hypothetical protein
MLRKTVFPPEKFQQDRKTQARRPGFVVQERAILNV